MRKALSAVSRLASLPLAPGTGEASERPSSETTVGRSEKRMVTVFILSCLVVKGREKVNRTATLLKNSNKHGIHPELILLSSPGPSSFPKKTKVLIGTYK